MQFVITLFTALATIEGLGDQEVRKVVEDAARRIDGGVLAVRARNPLSEE